MKPPGLLVLISLLPGAAAQQHERNPYDTPEAIAEGRRLYRFYCVNCHGMDGASGRGARLASTFRRYGASDKEMFRTIFNGIPGTEMPGLWQDEESVWKILAFVRTLEASAQDTCTAESGSAARGREVFFGKGGCLPCHTSGLQGGRLGPDLTWIGATRSRDHLRESLVEPDKHVAGRYRAVKVAASDGRRLEGVLLNEDGHSVHLMDRKERIHSLLHSEIKSVERPSRSLMPSYSGALTKAELEDLLSYLCGLRGPQGGDKR